MSNSEQNRTWVVYRATIRNKATVMNAVCDQDEWDALELARPGYHTLLKAGIENEGEAEKLARTMTVEGS